MVWVRSEYAGELAVLSVWANVLIPWSLSTAPIGGGQLYVLRFQFFLFQFLLGVDVEGQVSFLTVPGAVALESGAVRTAYLAWGAGAVALGLAFLLSIAYYAVDERLEAVTPVDPVRLLGGLLVIAGVLEGVAVVRLFQVYLGTTLPVGVLFCLVLGGVLLRVERA